MSTKKLQRHSSVLGRLFTHSGFIIRLIAQSQVASDRRTGLFVAGTWDVQPFFRSGQGHASTFKTCSTAASSKSYQHMQTRGPQWLNMAKHLGEACVPTCGTSMSMSRTSTMDHYCAKGARVGTAKPPPTSTSRVDPGLAPGGT